ncbi:MAG TPA: zf-HC2 domain-containing protein [Myxococcota bacterium]|nr:zf-HC2 domain-containing protein [Myxococcota bacterium]
MTRDALTCKQFVDFLMRYLDGELPQGERTTFETHLDDCPPCKVYLDTYRETVELGRGCGRDDDPVPADVPDALVRAILAARRS